MTNLTQSLKVILLAIVFSFGISYVFAWTAPTVAPTGGNSTAPLNTSNIDQTKVGGLVLNALGILNTGPYALQVNGGGVFGGNVSILSSASSFGAEQIDNGDFVDGSHWNYVGKWDFDPIYYEADHTPGSPWPLVQTSPTTQIKAGKTYQVVFEVKNWVDGSVRPRIGGTFGSSVTSNGTFIQQITTINNSVLSFNPSDPFDGSIDNVSLKMLANGDLNAMGDIKASGTVCDGTGECIGDNSGGAYCVFKRTGYSCPTWAPIQEGLQTIGFFTNLDDERTGASGHGYNITICCAL